MTSRLNQEEEVRKTGVVLRLIFKRQGEGQNVAV